jgi:hypothetical protein
MEKKKNRTSESRGGIAVSWMPTWSEARINTYIQNRQLNTTRSHLRLQMFYKHSKLKDVAHSTIRLRTYV